VANSDDAKAGRGFSATVLVSGFFLILVTAAHSSSPIGGRHGHARSKIRSANAGGKAAPNLNAN